jgi:hypothetical protein
MFMGFADEVLLVEPDTTPDAGGETHRNTDRPEHDGCRQRLALVLS